jgi:excisionase family DNA binding protein
MTRRTRPRINRDRPRPPVSRQLEADANREVRHRDHRNDRIKFFTIAEVAERLGVSTRTVRRWIDNRRLIAHRIDGVVRIAENDLRAFLALHRDS